MLENKTKKKRGTLFITSTIVLYFDITLFSTNQPMIPILENKRNRSMYLFEQPSTYACYFKLNIFEFLSNKKKTIMAFDHE